MKILFLTQNYSSENKHSFISSVLEVVRNRYDVDFLSCDIPVDFKNRLFLRTGLFDCIGQIRDYNQAIIRKALDFLPNIVFVSKGTYVHPNTILKISELLKNTKIACYYPDDPYSSIIHSANRYTKGALKLYDYFFVWSSDIRTRLEREIRARVYYVPFAAKPVHEFVEDAQKVFKYDISFVGNCDKERLNWILKLMDLPKDISIHVFGSGYPNNLRRIIVHEPVYTEEYFEILSSSKINLNILRNQNKNAHNMRSFEIPSVSSFMLHEYSSDISLIFRPGTEADYFRTAEELVSKCIYYLRNEALRESIAQNAYNRLVAGHTYYHRVEYMINCILRDSVSS